MDNRSKLLSNFTHGNNTTGTVFVYGLQEGILQAVFLGIIVVFGIASNSYICSVVYKNKNLRNPTFIFLVNLAIANIGALTMCTPFPLINSIRRKFTLGRHWCLANGFLNNFFFFISIFTLSLIAAQNYFTIVKRPSCEWLQITRKRAKFHLLGLWSICFVFSLLSLGPFESWSYVVFNPTTAHCGLAFPDTLEDKFKLSFLALIAFIIPVLGMSFAYCRIYYKVSSHEGKVNQNTQRRGNQSTAVTRKLAVTLCLMFGTFLICWLPFFVLIMLAIAVRDPFHLPWFLGRIAYWCGYLNCAVNPSLYCLRSSAFKDVMRRRSSSSGEVANKMFVRRQRAFSLPAIPATLIHPILKRMERQSYPSTVPQDSSLQELRLSTELNVARLRAYSCSSYEIKEKENTLMDQKRRDIEMLRSEMISKGAGDKFTKEISGCYVYERMDIRDLRTSITSQGNLLEQPELTETTSKANLTKEDITICI